MPLIKSISGIRGTIGGQPGSTLSPIDIVKYAASYAQWFKKANPSNQLVVVGRDGRMSGYSVKQLVINTLLMSGLDVCDLDYSTTPTVEMAVKFMQAGGGIILTASHNPAEWNALKLLNSAGEFLSAADGQDILNVAEAGAFEFVSPYKFGRLVDDKGATEHHINAILHHPLVNVEAIRQQQFSIVVDGINSTGATFVPQLLEALGVQTIDVINADVTGDFAHNPEPLPEHLNELCARVVKQNAHLGISVDPDVDRLCFVNEDGSLFGEEYTLVAVADYVLQHRPGNTVSNLSSTRALRDVTEKHGGTYYASAVGEVNVVNVMKDVQAVIGGEGNGGIIVPELHYGRDALIGIALFLSHLATSQKSAKQLRSTYPDYYMSKNKIELDPQVDVKRLFEAIEKKYAQQPINTIDGLKIEFDTDWVQLRTSNTEPIIRIYAESTSETLANNIAQKLIADIKEILLQH